MFPFGTPMKLTKDVKDIHGISINPQDYSLACRRDFCRLAKNGVKENLYNRIFQIKMLHKKTNEVIVADIDSEEGRDELWRVINFSYEDWVRP